MNTKITYPFNHQPINSIEHCGRPYVAMQPIAEHLGLDWNDEIMRIYDVLKTTAVVLRTANTDGSTQLVLCLPLSKLPHYLYSIDESKVSPQFTKTLIDYKKQCDEVVKGHRISYNNAINILVSPVFLHSIAA